MWLLTVTKFPPSCFLEQYINSGLFGCVMALIGLLTLLSMLDCFQIMQWSSLFILPALINLLDLTVIIPLSHWSINAAIKWKADEAPKDSKPPAAQTV